MQTVKIKKPKDPSAKDYQISKLYLKYCTQLFLFPICVLGNHSELSCITVLLPLPLPTDLAYYLGWQKPVKCMPFGFHPLFHITRFCPPPSFTTFVSAKFEISSFITQFSSALLSQVNFHEHCVKFSSSYLDICGYSSTEFGVFHTHCWQLQNHSCMMTVAFVSLQEIMLNIHWLVFCLHNEVNLSVSVFHASKHVSWVFSRNRY